MWVFFLPIFFWYILFFQITGHLKKMFSGTMFNSKMHRREDFGYRHLQHLYRLWVASTDLCYILITRTCTFSHCFPILFVLCKMTKATHGLLTRWQYCYISIMGTCSFSHCFPILFVLCRMAKTYLYWPGGHIVIFQSWYFICSCISRHPMVASIVPPLWLPNPGSVKVKHSAGEDHIFSCFW